MIADRLGASWEEIASVLISTVLIFAAVIVATRLAGLRSFSKMSAFDFAMTVAVGSLVATVAVTETPLLAGVVGLAALYGMQVAVAWLRRHSTFEQVVDNTPRLLMRDGRVLEEQLAAARITHDDLRAKLREANVLQYTQVRAVVLETTGDISVLHGGEQVDADLLRDVQGSEG